MIRTVLVGWSVNDWKLYRQPQWMAEVRRSPEATRLPRHHFDVPEAAFPVIVEAWDIEGAKASLDAARGLLAKHGAVEIAGP